MKNWKTTAVGVSQLVLGVAAFIIWSIGKINTTELIGSIGFITFIGTIVGNMFAADGKISTLASKARPNIGGDGLPESERD